MKNFGENVTFLLNDNDINIEKLKALNLKEDNTLKRLIKNSISKEISDF